MENLTLVVENESVEEPAGGVDAVENGDDEG